MERGALVSHVDKLENYVAVVMVMVVLVLVLVLVVLLFASLFFPHTCRICSLRLQSTHARIDL